MSWKGTSIHKIEAFVSFQTGRKIEEKRLNQNVEPLAVSHWKIIHADDKVRALMTSVWNWKPALRSLSVKKFKNLPQMS